MLALTNIGYYNTQRKFCQPFFINYSSRLKSAGEKSVFIRFLRRTCFLKISYSNLPQSGVDLSVFLLCMRQCICSSFPSIKSAFLHSAHILFMSLLYIILYPSNFVFWQYYGYFNIFRKKGKELFKFFLILPYICDII